MSSNAAGFFPLFARYARPLKSHRNPATFTPSSDARSARSEPLAAAVAVPVMVAFHPAMAPAPLAAKPAMVGQDGESPLLAVVERLVERIGRIRDLPHRSRRGRHVIGALSQPRNRI